MHRVKRIPSLDGLRAISILLVVLGHLAKSQHAPRVFWDHYAALGVRVFFVISGYLITTLLLREYKRTSTISLKNFYIRRSYRILPAALFFMAAATLVYWRDLRWYNTAAAFLYVANFDPTRPWIFGHLWSLSVEEQFYFLWPSVLKKWHKHRVAILASVFCLAPVIQLVLYYFKRPGGTIGGYPGVSANLAIGCLLAIFAPRMPRIRPAFAFAMLLVVALVPLLSGGNRFLTLVLVLILDPALYVSIAGLLLHVVQSPYRILNWVPVAWLGRISYSLYLWQQPFCSDPKLRSGYLAVFAIATACFSYYFVEQPMLRRREKSTPSSANESATNASIAAA